MEAREIQTFFEKHCKFKLRSGKEIFGVIWEVENGRSKEHYFASIFNHRLYKKAQRNNEYVEVERLMYTVNLDEIVHVERLVS